MISTSLRRPGAWAAALPLVCAAHCIAMPLVALFVPVLAVGSGVETGLMVASAALALWAARGGVRLHGRYAVWIPVLLGLGVWAASLAGWTRPLPEPVTTTLGSLLLAGGMVWNARLRHEAACRRCGCPAHHHG